MKLLSVFVYMCEADSLKTQHPGDHYEDGLESFHFQGWLCLSEAKSRGRRRLKDDGVVAFAALLAAEEEN